MLLNFQYEAANEGSLVFKVTGAKILSLKQVVFQQVPFIRQLCVYVCAGVCVRVCVRSCVCVCVTSNATSTPAILLTLNYYCCMIC